MRSLVLLLAVTAVCVAFGYASVVLREVEERLSSEQLRAELGLGSGACVRDCVQPLKTHERRIGVQTLSQA